MTERSPSVHERGHPGPVVYVYVALVLAVVTAVEVAIIYMALAQLVMMTILLLLSAGKFYIVAMFYMHLRYDDRLFSLFFGGGLALTAAVLTALLALFGIIG